MFEPFFSNDFGTPSFLSNYFATFFGKEHLGTTTMFGRTPKCPNQGGTVEVSIRNSRIGVSRTEVVLLSTVLF